MGTGPRRPQRAASAAVPGNGKCYGSRLV